MRSEPEHACAQYATAVVPPPGRTQRALAGIAAAFAFAVLAGCQTLEPASPEQPSTPGIEPITVPDVALRPLPDPAPAADIWERLRHGFNLPHVDDERIEVHLQGYTRTPVYMQRIGERAERYLYYILGEIEARGLPTELALVPIVESALDPFAYSHGQAAGIWQFIPSTGRKFGLEQDWWHDQRRDLVASTDAALSYLESLHDQFDGDWLLALAAYNAGPGNVRRAQRHNRNAGEPVDYFSLARLPAETRAYVPKVLALRNLILAPQSHGISLPELPNSPYFETVAIGSQIDIDLAARLAEVDTRELYLLNPALSRWATHPEGPHRLLVPVDSAAGLQAQLLELEPNDRIAWHRHQVEAGETLSVIAQKYQTDLRTLRQVNDLNGSLIRVGQTLMVPAAAAESEAYVLSEGQRDATRVNTTAARSGRQQTEHRVRAGESFWTIARQYGVGMRQLARWNGMATSDPLRVGQELVVWLPDTSESSAVNSQPVRETVTRPVTYRVRSGDSLARIASRFSIAVSDIIGWNELDPQRHLQPGQRLRLYVTVTGMP